MELRIEELASLIRGESVKSVPLTEYIGKVVFIRTVTYHYSGIVDSICGDFVKLTKAAWVADSGRFTQAVETAEFNEVEVYKVPLHINMTTIVDFCEIPKTNESQK